MPVPCPSDAPKLMFPVRFSSTRKMTSTSGPTPATGWTSGGGMGLWKNPRFSMLRYEFISASRLNNWPGTMAMVRRMTDSWVTSFPTMTILWIVAGWPS